MRRDFARRLDHAKCNTSLAELRKQFPEVTKGRYKLRDGGGRSNRATRAAGGSAISGRVDGSNMTPLGYFGLTGSRGNAAL